MSTERGYLAQQLGTALAGARDRAGLSQRAQAKALGIAGNTLRELEQGLANPTLARIESIAAAMGLRIKLVVTRGPQVTDEQPEAPDLDDAAHERIRVRVILSRWGLLPGQDVEVELLTPSGSGPAFGPRLLEGTVAGATTDALLLETRQRVTRVAWRAVATIRDRVTTHPGL